MREYWFIKRHKRHEIPWKIIQVEKDEKKMKIHQEKKFNQIEEDEEKKIVRYMSSKKCVQSSQENESALERIRGYHGKMQSHPRKMKVCQIERNKNAIEWKPIKFHKKEKEKESLLGWKPERVV